MSKKAMSEKIKITNGYLDTIANSPVVQAIVKKSFTAKTSYWLAKVFDKLQREARIYLAEKQKIIEKYAKRHDEDGAEKKDGKVIKSWKKGDMVSDGQSVTLDNVVEFQKEITELTEIEIELGINKIEFDLDKEPVCTVEEMGLLMPLVSVKED